MFAPLRVLILEDRSADAELMLHELRRAGFEPNWQRVETESDYLAHLDPALDLILADYSLPQFDALRALHLLQQRNLDIPFIIVTGTVGEEVAVECMKRGAADYLLKDRLMRLGQAVTHAGHELRLRNEKRWAEARLRESEQRFRSLFDGVPVGLYRSTPEGKWLDANAPLVQMLGCRDRESLHATNLFNLYVDLGERQRLQTTMEREGVVRGFDVQLRRHDGTVIWVRSSSRALRDEEGRTMYYEGTIEDITQRKQAEEALQRQREALYQSEKLATMGELLAGVAHELNNPLSVVMGQTALLRQAVGEGPLAERAGKIEQAAERCSRIVKNFLALARQHPPEQQRVWFNQVVQGAVELLAYPLRVDNVEVALDLAENLPVLWADPHKLQQVVLNLITNAHHAMCETPPPRRLTLTTRADPGRVSLEVADTGPGIPPDLRSRIFEPFFTTKPLGQGTGLGLSICHGIVEGHGGTIRVEGPSGQGAVFRVELPVEVPPREVPEAQTAETPPPIRGRAILVVDDEPAVAEVLVDLLAVDGHRVGTAANGALALERLRERDWDLILSDIKMPELDGPGLWHEVKRLRPELLRRFIFLTGDTISSETRGFLEQTGALSLGKPFACEEVRRVVQRVLSAP